MKTIKYYEVKLNNLVSNKLLPIRNDNVCSIEQQLYYSILRDIFCSLTYQSNLSKSLVEEKILHVYQQNYVQYIYNPTFSKLFPMEVVDKILSKDL